MGPRRKKSYWERGFQRVVVRMPCLVTYFLVLLAVMTALQLPETHPKAFWKTGLRDFGGAILLHPLWTWIYLSKWRRPGRVGAIVRSRMKRLPTSMFLGLPFGVVGCAVVFALYATESVPPGERGFAYAGWALGATTALWLICSRFRVKPTRFQKDDPAETAAIETEKAPQAKKAARSAEEKEFDFLYKWFPLFQALGIATAIGAIVLSHDPVHPVIRAVGAGTALGIVYRPLAYARIMRRSRRMKNRFMILKSEGYFWVMTGAILAFLSPILIFLCGIPFIVRVLRQVPAYGWWMYIDAGVTVVFLCALLVFIRIIRKKPPQAGDQPKKASAAPDARLQKYTRKPV